MNYQSINSFQRSHHMEKFSGDFLEIMYLENFGGPVKTNHPVVGVEQENTNAFQQLSVFRVLTKPVADLPV